MLHFRLAFRFATPLYIGGLNENVHYCIQYSSIVEDSHLFLQLNVIRFLNEQIAAA